MFDTFRHREKTDIYSLSGISDGVITIGGPGIPDTPKNRKMAGELRSSIVYRIKTGTFDYRGQFPDSPAFKNDVDGGKPIAIRDLADTWLKLKRPDWASSSFVTT
ncbi:Arm DNA-binding domain-containing protein [Pantoea ananatis]|uniref:Arm DNA-binding domain-containing protein n=1 Tax=Pantoea ananas TaxID=553 RepID=UPI00352BD0A7